MEKTLEKASQLTEAAQGKHHIGDFLPPEEVTKFMSMNLITRIKSSRKTT